MATVKPKKRATIVSTVKNAPKGVSGVSKPKPFTGAATKVTQPTAPAKPALASVPKIATGPPPPTLQSTSDRNQAGYDYGVMMGDTNTQLRSIAAQFGGAPQVTQYGYDPTKRADTQTALDVAPNQPGSTMEVLLRNLGLTKSNINDTATANNTFFGSRRLSELGDADTQYSGDVAAAKRAYDDAVSALTNAILTGRGTRNQNFTNADIADIQAAAAAPPQAQAAAPYDPWTDPSVDWNAVQAAFGKPTLNPAGKSGAQKTTGGNAKKKPKKK